MTADLRIVIISGLSGSGKSTASRALEDLGYFCVDNLPVKLLTRFVDLQTSSRGGVRKFAFVMDSREGEFLHEFPGVMDELAERGLVPEVIFLDCADEMLQRRFSEVRRPHPKAPEGSVAEGIRIERAELAPIRDRATWVIDTSEYTSHDLRREIRARFSQPGERPALTVQLVSFGYKDGLPREADLVMDVRFLPNPYFDPDLRDRPGLDPEVAAYALENDAAREFLRRFAELVNFLIPHYEKEGKSYLTIAVGCTGGQHRSVAVVEELRNRIEGRSLRLRVRHRDLEK